MLYADGTEAKPGDVVKIDNKYQGTVVACIEDCAFLAGYEHWAYLKEGLMVDTDFGGLVHYPPGHVEDMILLHRAVQSF